VRIKAKKSKLWERKLGFGFNFGQIVPMLCVAVLVFIIEWGEVIIAITSTNREKITVK
jgi:hypothetical protein